MELLFITLTPSTSSSSCVVLPSSSEPSKEEKEEQGVITGTITKICWGIPLTYILSPELISLIFPFLHSVVHFSWVGFTHTSSLILIVAYLSLLHPQFLKYLEDVTICIYTPDIGTLNYYIVLIEVLNCTKILFLLVKLLRTFFHRHC